MRVRTLLLWLAVPNAAIAQNPDVLLAGRYNQPGTYALTNVSVIDGTGAATRRNQTIIVAGGVIQFVGDAAAARPPGGATVLDLQGSTVLPGLIDSDFTSPGISTIAGSAVPRLPRSDWTRGSTTSRDASRRPTPVAGVAVAWILTVRPAKP
jgi:hypothetical protein